eukprot:COSAG01_NODE_662_length_14431_cov_31.385775_14_plen_117_part_00
MKYFKLILLCLISVCVIGGAALFFLKLGPFKQTLVSTKFVIKGMTCQSCVVKVQKKLAGLKGFKRCDINLKTGTAEVEFIEERLNKDKIIDEVKTLDYQVGPYSRLKLEGYQINFN